MYRDKNPIELLKEIAEEKNGQKDVVTDNLIDVYFDLFLDIVKNVNEGIYLKGNVLLNKLLPNEARGTKDLDLSVVDKTIYYEVVVPELERFGKSLVDLGVCVDYKIEDIFDHMSGGIKTIDSTGKILYSVDVSLSNVSIEGVREYNLGGSLIKGSSFEKIICDKCLSTLSRKRFRRIKDFYDLYILLKAGVKYDLDVVVKLMVEKEGLESVVGLIRNFPFSPEVLKQATYAWGKLNLMKAGTYEYIQKPAFNDVLSVIGLLYMSMSYTKLLRGEFNE